MSRFGRQVLLRVIECVALWFIVEDTEKPGVLLHVRKGSEDNKLYGPWFSDVKIGSKLKLRKEENENKIGALRRGASSLFGELFVQSTLTIKGYPFPNLLLIDEKEFFVKENNRGIRYHYFAKIKEFQLTAIEDRLEELKRHPFDYIKGVTTRVVTADDYYKIRQTGEEICKDTIVLFPDDFDVIMPYLENDAERLKLILDYDWP